MHPMLNIATKAVLKAGHFIIKKYESINCALNNTENINKIFFYNFKKEIKYLIIQIISKYYPSHIFIAKDNYYQNIINKNTQWIIDPINSFTNFIKQFPYFATSISIRNKGITEISVVYDPIHNELFSAIKGKGAKLNGYRIRGNTNRHLNNAILVANLPKIQKQNNTLYILNTLCTKCANLRCTGSSILDLVYIAAGRVDIMYAVGIHPCSIISGELIIKESGCLINDHFGNDKYLVTGNLISGNPKLVQKTTSIIKNISKK